MIQGAKLALYENYTIDYRRRIHRSHQLNTRPLTNLNLIAFHVITKYSMLFKLQLASRVTLFSGRVDKI